MVQKRSEICKKEMIKFSVEEYFWMNGTVIKKRKMEVVGSNTTENRNIK